MYDNIESVITEDNIELQNKTGFFTLKYYRDQIDNKFLKSAEKMVRTSPEYSKFLGIIKNYVGLNHDVFMAKVNGAIATIEFHHYPFTLFDMADIVARSMMDKKEKLSTFTLAHRLIDEHFKGNTGLVSLGKTNHKLYHAGKLFIPIDKVIGNVGGFIDDYRDFIYKDQIEKIEKIIEQSKEENKTLEILNLQRKYWNYQKVGE